MYLKEILTKIEKHLNENKMVKEDAAISIPETYGRSGSRLIDLNRKDILDYMLVGREGRVNYSYFEPIIECEKGKKVCTYVIYG